MLAIPGDDTQARRDCTMMPDEGRRLWKCSVLYEIGCAISAAGRNCDDDGDAEAPELQLAELGVRAGCWSDARRRPLPDWPPAPSSSGAKHDKATI